MYIFIDQLRYFHGTFSTNITCLLNPAYAKKETSVEKPCAECKAHSENHSQQNEFIKEKTVSCGCSLVSCSIFGDAVFLWNSMSISKFSLNLKMHCLHCKPHCWTTLSRNHFIEQTNVVTRVMSWKESSHTLYEEQCQDSSCEK